MRCGPLRQIRAAPSSLPLAQPVSSFIGCGSDEEPVKAISHPFRQNVGSDDNGPIAGRSSPGVYRSLIALAAVVLLIPGGLLAQSPCEIIWRAYVGPVSLASP